MKLRIASKYIAAAIFILFPLQAIADGFDFTPDATRILSDPTYMPLQGQLHGETTFGYSDFEGDRINSVGTKTFSFDTQSYTGTQSFGYGVTNDLELRFAMDFSDQGYTDNFTTGGATHGDKNGFSDPTFGVLYRALDQARNPVSLDFGLSYTPDFIDAKNDGAGQDGTVARGGQKVSAGISLGREMKSFTVQGTLSADYLGDRNVENLDDGSTTKDSSSWQYSGQLATQTRLTDRFSINSGVVYTIRDSFQSSNAAEGLSFTDTPGNVTDLYLGLNYHLVPNRLVATVGYDHYFLGSEKDTGGNPSFENGAWQNQDENLYLVSLRYVFF